jgi:hypothetical protein
MYVPSKPEFRKPANVLDQHKLNHNFAYCFVWGMKLGLSFSLIEENRFRMSENRMMIIFGPERKEVAGGWKRLHNEELHEFYDSFNIIM